MSRERARVEHAAGRVAPTGGRRGGLRRAFARDRRDANRPLAARVAGVGFLVEGDRLPLAQPLEAVVGDGRAVEEQVLGGGDAVRRDEAEAAIAQALDGSGRHDVLLPARPTLLGTARSATRRPPRSTGTVVL